MAERLIREPIDLDLVIQLVAEPEPEFTEPADEPRKAPRRRIPLLIALGGALLLFTMDGPPPRPHHVLQAIPPAATAAATPPAPAVTAPADQQPRIASVPAVAPQPPPAPALAGQLSVGGRDLLRQPLDTTLAQSAGLPVDGRDVLVQSVVADEGFWVGPNDLQRVLVYFHIDETPFQVIEGRRVNVRGVLSANPPGFERSFGIEPHEGADLLIRQAHHVVATEVTPADPAVAPPPVTSGG